MSVPVNINGIWRTVDKPQVNVNGIWRNTERWYKVNGIWRKDEDDIRVIPDEILGFKLIYRLDKYLSHPMYPSLKFNKDVKRVVDIAGERPVDYDLDAKSIIFRILNRDYDIEGSLVYRAELYADIGNGNFISVSYLPDSISSNNMDSLAITMDGYSMYESHGPYIVGWNQFFSYTNNLPSNQDEDKNLIRMNSYNILPTYSRNSLYSSFALIGIARNMTSSDHNMIGSSGVIDQTIEQICLDGVAKPFAIEIYD